MPDPREDAMYTSKPSGDYVVIDPNVPPPLPPTLLSGPLPFSILCRGCGYDLTGLDVGGLCPECSKPVHDSLQGDLLAFAPKDYLQSLHRGTVAVLASILFYVLGTLASAFAGVAMAFGAGAGGGTTRAGSALAMQSGIAAFGVGISIVYTVISVAGWYWFTEPDPGISSREKADLHRRVTRGTAIANGICGIVSAVFSLFGLGLTQSLVTANGGAPGAGTPTLSGPMIVLIVVAALFGLGVFALWAVQIIFSLNYMAWLANRVPDQALRKTSLQYRWVLPLIFVVGYVCAGLGPLIALVLYYNLISRFRVTIRKIRLQRGYGASLLQSD